MAQHNSKLREAQIVQTTEKSSNPSLALNLTQIPRPKGKINGH
jgi:hypothetical protein